MISEHDIDRARMADIVQVIRSRTDIKKTGQNWSGCCPFHKENTPSFTVSEQKLMYYCFGCGAGGGTIDFVMAYDGVSFPAAVESINGGLSLESSSAPARPAAPRAITCSLPGHAEDREKTARILDSQALDAAYQHDYLLRNNTAPKPGCLTLKGSLIVPIINNIGEMVNLAAISADGLIKYAAGAPSFGSTAIIDPAGQHDGRTIICADYAHAWRIWWANGCNCRVLCTMSADNLSWMLANCRDRFTHVGCDPLESEWYQDAGHDVVLLPTDPYARIENSAAMI